MLGPFAVKIWWLSALCCYFRGKLDVHSFCLTGSSILASVFPCFPGHMAAHIDPMLPLSQLFPMFISFLYSHVSFYFYIYFFEPLAVYCVKIIFYLVNSIFLIFLSYDMNCTQHTQYDREGFLLSSFCNVIKIYIILPPNTIIYRLSQDLRQTKNAYAVINEYPKKCRRSLNCYHKKAKKVFN